MSGAFYEAMQEGKIRQGDKLNNFEKSLLPSDRLTDKHKKDWLNSGLTEESIEDLDPRTNLTNDGWVIGYKDITSKETLGYRTRYDGRVIEENKYPSSEGKTPKYRSPQGFSNKFFYPHLRTIILNSVLGCSIKKTDFPTVANDTEIPLNWTEGEKKASLLTQEGYPCIALSGVNNWLTKEKRIIKNKDGVEEEKEVSVPIKDFDDINHKDRKEYIIFDSDKYLKPQVLIAEAKLFNYLKSLGADVKVINLPEDKEAKGIDDFWIKYGDKAEASFNRLIKNASEISFGHALLANKSKPSEVPHFLAKSISSYEEIVTINVGTYIYSDGCYKHLSNNQFRKLITNWFSKLNIIPKSRMINETMSLIQVYSFKESIEINPDDMHNIANGIIKLNLDTFEIELIEHTSDIFFTYKSKAKYNKNVDLVIIKEFLSKVIPDQNQQKSFLEGIAVAIFSGIRKNIDFTKFFLMLGTGSNGKTIITNFSEQVIGKEACSHVTLDQLIGKSEQRFIRAELFGKLANFATENNLVTIFENSTIKAISSGKPGDELTVEKKHKDPFQALINPILFFALNKQFQLPPDRTDAMLRRIQVIDCPNKFSSTPKEGEHKKDSRLENENFTIPHVEGMLILIINAAIEMLQRGYPWEEGNEKSLQKAILKGSHLERFKDGYLMLGEELSSSTRELYEEYINFCINEEGIAIWKELKDGTKKVDWIDESKGTPCKSDVTFGRWLSKKFNGKIEPCKLRLDDGSEFRGYKGIGIKRLNVEDDPSIRPISGQIDGSASSFNPINDKSKDDFSLDFLNTIDKDEDVII